MTISLLNTFCSDSFCAEYTYIYLQSEYTYIYLQSKLLGKRPFCALCLCISCLLAQHNDNNNNNNNKINHVAPSVLLFWPPPPLPSTVPGGFLAAKELMGWLFPAPYIPKKLLIWRFQKGKGSCQQKRKGLKWCNWPFLSWLKPTTGWAAQFRSGGRYSGFLRGRSLRSAELSLCMWAACFEQLSIFREGWSY